MKKPTVHPDAFVAFNATVRGDVRIEEGAEATLTLVDPHASFTVTADFLAGHGKNTPFIGRTLDGRAMWAFVEGKAILSEGEVVSQ